MPLSVTLGRVHDYLGMTVDFSTERVVHFVMEDYVNRLLGKIDKPEFNRVATLPAAPHFSNMKHTDPILLDECASIISIVWWPSCCIYATVHGLTSKQQLLS